MAQTVFDSGTRGTAFTKRFYWGAIFAGVVVVLVTSLMLNLLGVSFGAASIDPLQEKNPMSGLGIGSLIWFGVTVLLSLFAGGWVSARLSPTVDRVESTLHGVVVWGLSTLAVAYLVTTAVAGVLTGAAGVLGKTASLAGLGMKAIGPEVAQAIDGPSDDGFSWSAVKSEAQALLRQTKKPKLQPKSLESVGTGLANDAKAAATTVAQNPQAVDVALSSLWDKIEARGERVLDASDETALANILVARTDMTKEQAMSTVARWKMALDDAKNKFASLKAKAEQKVREVADSTAEAVSKAAAWSFVGLLLGLFSAVVGGYFGAPTKSASVSSRRYSVPTQESAA